MVTPLHCVRSKYLQILLCILDVTNIDHHTWEHGEGGRLFVHIVYVILIDAKVGLEQGMIVITNDRSGLF